jgi:hypothetical protein
MAADHPSGLEFIAIDIRRTRSGLITRLHLTSFVWLRSKLFPRAQTDQLVNGFVHTIANRYFHCCICLLAHIRLYHPIRKIRHGRQDSGNLSDRFVFVLPNDCRSSGGFS